MKAILRVILTPLCAALSAALTGWLAKHFPGLTLTSGQVTTIMVAGAVAGASGALHWLQSQPKVVHLEDDAKAELAKIRAAVSQNTALAATLADLKNELRTHTVQILNGVATQLHAPQSIVRALDQIVQALESQKVGEPVVEAAPAPEPVSVVPPA